MANYNYIFQKLHLCMEVLIQSEGSPLHRLRKAISTGAMGQLSPPITHIPDAIAPRLTALQASIDRVVASGPEGTDIDDAMAQQIIQDWFDLFTWVCHMRGPDHALGARR